MITLSVNQNSHESQSEDAGTYEWSAPEAVPATGTDSVFSAYFPHAGQFYIHLKASNQYGSSEKVIPYTVEDCITPTIEALHPSPATDYLEFELSSLVPEDFKIRVYAMNGQEVVFLAAHTQSLGEPIYRLDLPPLPMGLYMLVLDVYGEVLTRPFLIGH
ncbi:MAG: PKD domain-containing protein [Saprospiraceae bacterium]